MGQGADGMPMCRPIDAYPHPRRLPATAGAFIVLIWWLVPYVYGLQESKKTYPPPKPVRRRSSLGIGLTQVSK